MLGSDVRRTVIVLAALLVLSTALCLVHGDAPGFGHRAVSNVCCAVTVATFAVVPLLALVVAGWTSTVGRMSIPFVSPLVLEPPPKARLA